MVAPPRSRSVPLRLALANAGVLITIAIEYFQGIRGERFIDIAIGIFVFYNLAIAVGIGLSEGFRSTGKTRRALWLLLACAAGLAIVYIFVAFANRV